MRFVDEQRPSVDGSGAGWFVLASTTVLMALAGAFFMLPLLFLAPVPLAALVYRNGYRAGTVTAIVTLFLVALVQQRALSALPTTISDAALQAYSLATMIALVTMGLIGLVIGGAWREGSSWPQAFWLGAGAGVLPLALAWAVALLAYDVDLFTSAFQRWMEVVRGIVADAARNGLTPETAQALEQAVADTEASFAMARPLIPGLIAFAAIAGSFVNTGLAGWMLTRLGHRVPTPPAFASWRFPWPLAVLFVIAQALLLGGAERFGAAVVVAQNALMVLNALFALQGAAVGWHWLGARRVATPLKVALLLAVYWWIPFVLVWAGVLDTWLNFRRLPGGGRNASGAPVL